MDALLTILPLLISAVIVCDFVAWIRRRRTVEYGTHVSHHPGLLPGSQALNAYPLYRCHSGLFMAGGNDADRASEGAQGSWSGDGEWAVY